MKLLRVFKFIFLIWLVLCLCVISAFLVLSFISKDRIYKADLNIAQKTILDSKEISYEAKIKFNSIFFRAQKNLSNIEIIDFGFADSMINDNAGGGGESNYLDFKNLAESKLDSINNTFSNTFIESANIDSIESKSTKTSQNLDSIESKLQKYHIHNFTHNVQTRISFSESSQSIPPTHIYYKVHFVSFSNFIKMIAPYALITLFVLYLIALCFNTFAIIAAQMPQKQMPPQNKSLNKTDRIFLISTATICLSICAFSFWLGFPGYIVDADIFSALNLNKNNWHPVFTAYILQILYAIFGKHTFYLFLINLIPFYVGIFFLIAGFYLHFRSKFALLLIFPTFIGNLYFSNFVCMSYIALGNMCFCAYSMILFLLLYTPRVWIRRVMWSGIFVLLFFALLWRHNAIFSVFPAFLIICYMFLQQAQLDSRIFIRNYIKLVFLSALMCVIIVKSLPAIITKGNSNPASHIFLYQLVGACVRANDSECIPRDWYVKGKNFNDLKQEYYANKTYWYGISSLNTDNPPNLMLQYKKYFFKYFKYFVSHQWQFFKIMARQIPNDDVTGWVQSSVKSYATLSAKPTHEWHKSVAKQFKENERYIHFSESKKEIYDFMFNHKILLSNKWSVAGSFAIMIISCLLLFSVRFRGLLSFDVGNLGSRAHSLLVFSFASSAASFFSFVFICLFIAFSWSRYTAPLLPLAIISLIGFFAFIIESKINKK